MTPSEIADIPFNYWLSQDDLSIQEQLEMIKDVHDNLIKCGAESSKEIAYALESKVEKFIRDNNLCPKCYSENLKSKTIYQGYYQPPEMKVWCEDCNYVEYY